MYTHVCNFTTRTKPTNLRNGEGDAKISGKEAAGYKLYGRLQKFLRSYLEALFHDAADLAHSDVLKFYSDKWERFKRSSNALNNILYFLNNNWLKQELKEGNKDVYDTTNLCILSWKKTFLASVLQPFGKNYLKYN
ncbi:hypothetical protein HPB48_015565 [Haemaphysalis longicornis]|uniref:Cullin N-terminal domain-containing protein n=1 Tax=Haemaphysalis longicornis TaxID=44386 RepID=A0A9J6FJH3_HAELO|nr:hypothetical protein HPB48_015565 [Haemaphysalis longicornis]